MSPDLLNQTCAVQAATESKTATGGATRTWATVSGKSALPCHVQQEKSETEEISGTLRLVEKVRVFFDEDPGISTRNALLINNRRYKVTDEEDIAGLGESWEVLAVWIEGVDDGVA